MDIESPVRARITTVLLDAGLGYSWNTAVRDRSGSPVPHRSGQSALVAPFAVPSASCSGA